MNCTVTVSARRPHPPANADLGVRVGDREREKVIARLGQAFTQGYLSIPEYQNRLKLQQPLAPKPMSNRHAPTVLLPDRRERALESAQAPLARHALQVVLAAVGEPVPRAGDDVAHRR